MIENTIIDGLRQRDLEEKVFEELIRLWPKGHDKTLKKFASAFPLGSPMVDKIVDALRSYGYEPTPLGSAGGPRHYYFRHKRTYDDSDLREAELLRFCGPPPYGSNVTLLDGPSRDQTIRKIDLRVLDWDWPMIAEYSGVAIAVPQHRCPAVENQGFVGPTFRELKPFMWTDNWEIATTEAWKEFEILWEKLLIKWKEQPWVEIDTLIEMPPVSPRQELLLTNKVTQSTGLEPVRGDLRSGYAPVERYDGAVGGYYSRPELHYLRSEVEAMGEFDLARVYECFGNPVPSGEKQVYQRLSCPLIFSQRMFSFCHDQGLTDGWQPVRIDED